jgi:hypothetical protein
MTRKSLKILLVAALGTMALLALPALASAKAKDRNHDRIPDRWEKRHHLSLKVNQAKRDQDRDHLRNRAEFMAGDNPRDRDSDNDGIPDGEENAGTITSFDTETGKLTIALFGGDSVSGLVTDETEIECAGNGGAATASHEDGESNDGEEASDNEEAAEEESGDDHGEEADDEGEDGEEADDQEGDHSESGEHASGGGSECSTSDLVEGAVVKEAELQVSNGQAVFEKVELAE